MNYYERESEIARGEHDKLKAPERSEPTCATLGCNREPIEDEEYCPECLQCNAEYLADMQEDR